MDANELRVANEWHVPKNKKKTVFMMEFFPLGLCVLVDMCRYYDAIISPFEPAHSYGIIMN